MTWQSHAEHGVSWLSPSCAEVVMMVGKGKAAAAEKKPPHICKVAVYIIAWLRKGKPRQGGRKRSTCGHKVTLIPVLEGTLSASQPCMSALRAGGAQGLVAHHTETWPRLPTLQLCGQGCLQASVRCARLQPLTWTATLLAAVSSF